MTKNSQYATSITGYLISESSPPKFDTVNKERFQAKIDRFFVFVFIFRPKTSIIISKSMQYFNFQVVAIISVENELD